jgi:TM2 domain-containing membrane protein YozV
MEWFFRYSAKDEGRYNFALVDFINFRRIFMNIAVKAALFSGLLFPGWGQIYLKKYKRGIAFILPVLAGIIFICWSLIQVVMNTLKAAPPQKGSVDINAVLKLTDDSLRTLDSTTLSSIMLIIIGLWIYSVIDAYIAGKKMMSVITTSADQQSTSPQA